MPRAPLAIGLAALGFACPILHAAPQETPMPASASRTVAMNVVREGGTVVVRVVGRSDVPKVVRFALDVDSRSTTRNMARGSIGPDPRTLSVVRFADLPPWQVTLQVDEQGADSYTLHATDKSSD